MYLFDKITLTVIEHLTDKLELSLVDYENGGFLPPEKRAIRLEKQKRTAELARRAAQMRILEQEPKLRAKLLLFAKVLNNEQLEFPPSFSLSTQRPRRG